MRYLLIVFLLASCSSFQQEPIPEFYEKLRIDPIEIDFRCEILPENDEYEECVMVA